MFDSKTEEQRTDDLDKAHEKILFDVEKHIKDFNYHYPDNTADNTTLTIGFLTQKVANLQYVILELSKSMDNIRQAVRIIHEDAIFIDDDE